MRFINIFSFSIIFIVLSFLVRLYKVAKSMNKAHGNLSFNSSTEKDILIDKVNAFHKRVKHRLLELFIEIALALILLNFLILYHVYYNKCDFVFGFIPIVLIVLCFIASIVYDIILSKDILEDERDDC